MIVPFEPDAAEGSITLVEPFVDGFVVLKIEAVIPFVEVEMPFASTEEALGPSSFLTMPAVDGEGDATAPDMLRARSS